MEISINILVIILAITALLVLYNTFIKKGHKNQDYQLPFRGTKTEYEVGEEIGVDILMKESSNSSVSEETQIENPLSETGFYPIQENYNKTFVRLFSRDPYYLFTYWEIKEYEFYQNAPILRLFHIEEDVFKDIEINHYTKKWYLKVEPGNRYKVEIGYTKNGIFFPLASSRIVSTPLDRPSALIDEHWMTIEELSYYCVRVEMDSLTLLKNIKGRKIEEELEANSLTLIKK